MQDKYYALSRREQVVVVVGGLAVALFLLLQLVFLPTHDRLNRLRISAKNKERTLLELNTIAAQYKTISANRQDGGKPRGEAFSLFSVLEKFATESGLMDKIEYMRPGSLQVDPLREEKWVEIKLGRVTLKEFTDYLGRDSILRRRDLHQAIVGQKGRGVSESDSATGGDRSKIECGHGWKHGICNEY